MKSLQRPDLFCWSTFDAERNMDFNSVLWKRDDGNVAVDPLPLSDHDRRHVEALGGIACVVVTSSDHIRDTAAIASAFGARVAGPSKEKDGFALTCDRWLTDGDTLVDGVVAMEMQGSKTPGELALRLGEHSLVTGDLIRSHQGGRLMLLPDSKLSDRAAAVGSVERLLDFPSLEAVLVGDGWHVFRDGAAHLRELVADLKG